MADDEAELQHLEREVTVAVKARTDLEERLANPGAAVGHSPGLP